MKTKADKTTHRMPAAYTGDYPTSPFVTGLTGVKTLWENGRAIAAGVVSLQFVLLVASMFLFFVAFAAGFVLVLLGMGDPSFSNEASKFVPKDLVSASNGLATVGPASGTVFVISLVITLLFGVFLQALALAYVGQAVALRQKTMFGKVVRTAIGRMWPLAVQGILVALASGAAVVIAALISALLLQVNLWFIVLVFLMLMALAVGGFYLLARLAFCGLGVVVSNLGPVQAIKHSWQLTKGHVSEVVGIGALMLTVCLAVSLVANLLSFLAGLTGSQTVSLLTGLLVLVINLTVGYVVLAMLTERYAQLLSLAHTKAAHKADWGDAIAAIGIACLAGTVISAVQFLMILWAASQDAPATPETFLQDSLQEGGNSNSLELTPEERQKLYDDIFKSIEESANDGTLYQ